jgi:hypothetical protein
MKWFWARISSDVERGARLYEDTAYHFSPLWAWLLFLFRRAPGWIGFDAALRTFLTGVDIVSAWLLLRIARKERLSGWAWKAPVLFLTNPVSIWVSSVQGQFDNLSLLFLLAAVLVTPEDAAWKPGTQRSSGFWLSLSLAAKQVTLFHPLLWLRRRGGFLTVAIAFILPALLFITYAGQWRAILGRLLVYSSVPRSYGFSEFVLYDARWAPVIGAVDFLAAAAAALTLGKERLPAVLLPRDSLFAPGLGSQYLIWPSRSGSVRRMALLPLPAASIAWTLGSTMGSPAAAEDGPSHLARLRPLGPRRAPFPAAPRQAREVLEEGRGIGPAPAAQGRARSSGEPPPERKHPSVPPSLAADRDCGSRHPRRARRPGISTSPPYLRRCGGSPPGPGGLPTPSQKREHFLSGRSCRRRCPH